MGNGPAAKEVVDPSPAIKVGTAVETGYRDNAEGKTCDADIEELAVPPPLERRRPATLRGLAPSGRGMDGRCGGSGFVAWVRGIPENPDDDGAAKFLAVRLSVATCDVTEREYETLLRVAVTGRAVAGIDGNESR